MGPIYLKDKTYQILQRIMAPPRCLNCHQSVTSIHRTFCDACAHEIYPVEGKLCATCGHPLDDLPVPTQHDFGGQCVSCEVHQPPYDLARAPYRYDGTLSATIQRIKYGKREMELAQLSRWARPALHDLICAFHQSTGPLTVIPIPPTRRSLRRRGFHIPSVFLRDYHRWYRTQPEHTQIECNPNILRRHGRSRAQAGLALHDRRPNVAGDFYCVDEVPKHVCLLDDVMTTGATVEDASRALKARGAVTVQVITLCRRMAKL